MAITDMAVAPPMPGGIAIRSIDARDLSAALREGYADFLAKRGDLIFIGVLYPMIGLLTAIAALSGTSSLPMLFPAAAGLSLLGPLVATGFYELARRREAGLESTWRHFLDVARSPSAPEIATVGTLLIAIFIAWLVAAGLIYEAFMGGLPASLGAFLRDLLTTPGGWAMIVVGNLVGLGFAIVVLAVSVVSLPMLVDRRIDAATAVATSIRAVRQDFAVMARWGTTVALLLALGSIPMFLGLAVVLPVLGYATWHLYTKVIDRSTLPPNLP